MVSKRKELLFLRKRLFISEHNEEDAAHSPNIDVFVVVFAFSYLRSNEGRCARVCHHQKRFLSQGVFEALCHVEVDQGQESSVHLILVFSGDHHIVRVNVSKGG
jgi:hypothetical protein